MEQTASKLSEMMASAKNDSARIITDAKATAARITENAGKQAENIIENAKATAKRHLNEQNGKIDAVYRQFDGFCAELLEYKETISNAAGAMSEKIDALHKSAVIAKSRVPEGAFSAEAPLASVEEIAIAETRPPKNGDDVLSQLGVQKDDSGFFRLAAEE